MHSMLLPHTNLQEGMYFLLFVIAAQLQVCRHGSFSPTFPPKMVSGGDSPHAAA
jgi:hypothetical protein